MLFQRIALVLLAGAALNGCAGPGMLAFPERAERKVAPFTRSFEVTDVEVDFSRLYYQFGMAGLRRDGFSYEAESGGMAQWFKRKIEARARDTGAVGSSGEPVSVAVQVNQYSMTEEKVWLLLFPNLIPTLSLWSIFGGPFAAYHVQVDVVFSATCGPFTKDYPYQYDDSSLLGFYYGMGNWPGIHMAPLVDRFVVDLASDLRSGAPSQPRAEDHPGSAAQREPEPTARGEPEPAVSQPHRDWPMVPTDRPRDYVFVAALDEYETALAYVCPAGYFREHGKAYGESVEQPLRLDDVLRGWYEAEAAVLAPPDELTLAQIHDLMLKAGFVYDPAFADCVAESGTRVHRPR